MRGTMRICASMVLEVLRIEGFRVIQDGPEVHDRIVQAVRARMKQLGEIPVSEGKNSVLENAAEIFARRIFRKETKQRNQAKKPSKETTVRDPGSPSPLYSGERGSGGEGATLREALVSSMTLPDTCPLIPDPSPPEYRGRREPELQQAVSSKQ